MARDHEYEDAKLQQTAAPKDRDIYDAHRRIVNEWHAACRQVEQAVVKRDQLREELDKISHDFHEHLSILMRDPTDPQPPMPSQAGNG